MVRPAGPLDPTWILVMADYVQRQTAGLVKAGLALASELDLDALFERIADLAREVVGASYGAVGVVGENGLLLRFVYSGIDQDTPTGSEASPTAADSWGSCWRAGGRFVYERSPSIPTLNGFRPTTRRSTRSWEFRSSSRSSLRAVLSDRKAGRRGVTKDDERIA